MRQPLTRGDKPLVEANGCRSQLLFSDQLQGEQLLLSLRRQLPPRHPPKG